MVTNLPNEARFVPYKECRMPKTLFLSGTKNVAKIMKLSDTIKK